MSAGISDDQIKAMRDKINKLAEKYKETAPVDAEKTRIYEEIKTFVDKVMNSSPIVPISSSGSSSSSSSSSSSIIVPNSGNNPTTTSPTIQDKSIILSEKIIPSSSGGDLPKLTGYEKIVGFDNSAKNHCYLNAALQMFYHVPEFYNFIAGAKDDMEGVGPIRQAFAMLEGKLNMGANTSCIEGDAQQDVDAYIKGAIMNPFDKMEVLRPFKVKEKVRDQFDSVINDTDRHDKVDIMLNMPGADDNPGFYNLLTKSMISHVEGSETKNKEGVITDTTGHIFTTYTVIPDSNKYLYMPVVRMEYDKDEAANNAVVNEVALEEDPNFEAANYTGAKQDEPIDTMETIQLHSNPLDRQSKQIKYKLRGFISHGGGTSYGHYVYYWYNGGKWMLFDDSSAEELKQAPEEEMKLGYIYLYELIGGGEEGEEEKVDHMINTYIVKPEDNYPYYITFDINIGNSDGWERQGDKKYWTKPFVNESENDSLKLNNVFTDTDKKKYLVISENNIDKKLEESLADMNDDASRGRENEYSAFGDNGYDSDSSMVSRPKTRRKGRSGPLDMSSGIDLQGESGQNRGDGRSLQLDNQSNARADTARDNSGSNKAQSTQEDNPEAAQPTAELAKTLAVTGSTSKPVATKRQGVSQAQIVTKKPIGSSQDNDKLDKLRGAAFDFAGELRSGGGGNSRRRKSKKRRFQTLKNKKR